MGQPINLYQKANARISTNVSGKKTNSEVINYTDMHTVNARLMERKGAVTAVEGQPHKSLENMY